MKPAAVIYRSDLLPPSETFIAAQAAALRRYQPVFAGLRSCVPSLPLGADRVVLAGEHTAARLLYQHLGHSPSFLSRVRARQPSLVHAHFALDGAEALPLARALRLPLIVTLHGYDVMCSDPVHGAHRRGRLYLRRRERLWRGAARFICVSDAVRARAQALGFPAEKLRVLPIGIDTDLLAFRAPLSCEPRILFVGRLVPKKGCDVLIRAMKRVQEALPGARLTIAGDGPERHALEALAAQHTHGTEFVGMQTPDQARSLMRSARCLAAPSLQAPDGDSEGLPTVLCEALALGLPVAGTFHSGIPELVRHGEHGLLSPEGDSEVLARHLLRLCTDDAAAQGLRAAGRRRVERSFNLQRQTALLEEIYDEAVRGGGEAQHGLVPALAASAASKLEDSPPPTDAAGKVREPGGSKSGAGALLSGQAGQGRLRHQAAWLLSGNGLAILLQALYFLLMGRMLGPGEYGAFIGVVALVNVLSQFSSLGMEMVLLRAVARERAAFAETWARSLVVSSVGFVLLLLAASVYGRFFLQPALRELLPYLALSDALFGKLTQLGSRAFQGAGLARWSAKLLTLTSAARAGAAAILFTWAAQRHAHVAAITWARVYCLASLLVAAVSFAAVTRLLGRPRWKPIGRGDLLEGLSFSFSSSAISIYNDIDKTMLVSAGMLHAAGVYGAAYRVIDVVSTPIYSLFAAASPKLFREGAEGGPPAAQRAAQRLLRWTIPFGLASAPALFLCAPVLPRLFGHSFAGSTAALRFLCLIPLLRGFHYAWGTAITTSASQWLRTGAQAGAAALNALLNLALIPRWGWQGAAAASLATDAALALSTGLILRHLAAHSAPAPLHGLAAGGGALQCAE